MQQHKSDHIPGPIPLQRWADRLSVHGNDLADLAAATHWRSDRPRTLALARSLYAHLPNGAAVWNSPKQVGTADTNDLLALLAPL